MALKKGVAQKVGPDSKRKSVSAGDLDELPSDWKKSTNDTLKTLLKARGLKVGGKKADLIARLEAWEETHAGNIGPGLGAADDDGDQSEAKKKAPAPTKKSTVGPKKVLKGGFKAGGSETETPKAPSAALPGEAKKPKLRATKHEIKLAVKYRDQIFDLIRQISEDNDEGDKVFTNVIKDLNLAKLALLEIKNAEVISKKTEKPKEPTLEPEEEVDDENQESESPGKRKRDDDDDADFEPDSKSAKTGKDDDEDYGVDEEVSEEE